MGRWTAADLLAILGLAGGAASAIVRTFLSVEELTERALAAQRQSQRQVENQRLDALARQLRMDRDHRTQDCLYLLRSVRDEFEQLAERADIQRRSAQLGEQFSRAFQAAVEQLYECDRLSQRADSLVGPVRDQALADRERLVTQVQTATEKLQATVKQFSDLMADSPMADWDALHQELDIRLDVARRTEERLRELTQPSAGYESFVKEP